MEAPTQTVYKELQEAYKVFNQALFGGTLPDCLITLNRKSLRVIGYFAAKRFENAAGGFTDELAMNPAHFHRKPIAESLQTLGHEMVHVWQSHLGKPGRGGYHNKEWAAKMKEIGLYPSSTGEPGGRELGDQMTHYLIEGSAIDSAMKKLMTKGFRLSWAERIAAVTPLNPDDGDGEGDDVPVNRSNRIKYTCPSCGVNAWGGRTLKLICGVCNALLAADGNQPADDKGY